MPIEIKEIQVKAVVANATDQQGNAILKSADIPGIKKAITRELTKEKLKTQPRKKKKKLNE